MRFRFLGTPSLVLGAPLSLRRVLGPRGAAWRNERAADARARWRQVDAIRRSIFLVKLDPFGKPVSTFPDHALVIR
jgi:hypothetical protein